jgi:hypothetical protein
MDAGRGQVLLSAITALFYLTSRTTACQAIGMVETRSSIGRATTDILRAKRLQRSGREYAVKKILILLAILGAIGAGAAILKGRGASASR